APLAAHPPPTPPPRSPPPPADPASAFVPLDATVDLDALLADEAERVVGRDNVVSVEGLALPLPKQPGRRSCAGLRVTVRRHFSGEHTVWRGPQCLGRYDTTGQPPGSPPASAATAPPAGASAARRPRRVSGQIMCQNQADTLLVNNSHF